MRIALIGEYSNVHASLATGLRTLGHEVVVLSDGDGWKQYPRDIDLHRSHSSKLGGLLFTVQAWQALSRLKGFDIVQLINPVFINLKAERILPFYRLLRRNNRCIIMCAMGIDSYYVSACLDGSLSRSDLSYHGAVRPIKEVHLWQRDWINGAKGRLNRQIAADCDHIVAGLPEYHAAYCSQFSQKLSYIPLPIAERKPVPASCNNGKVRFFIGIQQHRNQFKGTDIMLCALEQLACEMPQTVEILRAESLPYAQYSKMMEQSDVVLDQLYGYGPAMNGLLAMSMGKVVVTGLEPETYTFLNETTLAPIQGVEPSLDSLLTTLRRLALNPAEVRRLGRESLDFVLRHHAAPLVARQYETLYKCLLGKQS